MSLDKIITVSELGTRLTASVALRISPVTGINYAYLITMPRQSESRAKGEIYQGDHFPLPNNHKQRLILCIRVSMHVQPQRRGLTLAFVPFFKPSP